VAKEDAVPSARERRGIDQVDEPEDADCWRTDGGRDVERTTVVRNDNRAS
jgi:hypothetical protein